MNDYDLERLNDVEIDLRYCMGEVADLGDRLYQSTITEQALAERLEGVEARLAEAGDLIAATRETLTTVGGETESAIRELFGILSEYLADAPGEPFWAADNASLKLRGFAERYRIEA